LRSARATVALTAATMLVALAREARAGDSG
jgi:hypothetical protein